MVITLHRDVLAPDFTLGKLEFDGLPLFTCEDAVRDVKIPGVTAIPAGKYKVVVTFSNRFQKHLPLLLDVPNFSGIRIHAGNVHQDTEGCVLVGMSRIKGGVANSRYAMNLLMDKFKEHAGKDIYIEIVQ